MNLINDRSVQDVLNNHLIPLLPGVLATNSFTYPVPIEKSYRVLSCLSKDWNCNMNNINSVWKAKHNHLITQLEDLQNQNYQTIDPLIVYLRSQNYEVVDLSSYSWIDDQALEQLFHDCPFIKHLLIKNNTNITKLPVACSHLQTLDCTSCDNLVSLPKNMIALTSLNSSQCDILKNLPNGMENLRELNCSDCSSLRNLPDGMKNLKELNCSGCYLLETLPFDIENIKNIDCTNCTELRLPRKNKNVLRSPLNFDR